MRLADSIKVWLPHLPCLWLFFICSTGTFAQSYRLSQQRDFYHASLKHGVRSTAFNDVIEDHNGFIWATTTQGGQPGSSNLIKHDGYSFKVFGNNFHALNDLQPYNLACLLEGSNGDLFIGTNKGLFIFKPEFNLFYVCHSSDKNELVLEVVNLFEDSQQRVWVGGREKAYLFDDNALALLPLEGPSFGYTHNNWPGIKAFGEDSHGRIWAGSDRGLFLVDAANLVINHIAFPNQPEWNDPEIRVFKRYSPDHFYLGTSNGLWQFDANELLVRRLPVPGQASTNSIHDIILENNQLRWIGTDGGLLYYDKGHFERYTHDPDNEFSLSADNIRALTVDKSGNLWIATGDGLDILFAEGANFPFYQISPGYKRGLNYIYKIMEDQYGALWFRNPGAGLVCADSLNGAFRIVLPNTPTQPDLGIKNTILLPSGKIWAATGGSGIYEIDPLEKIPRRLELGDSVLTLINFIQLDPVEPKYVWAQTNYGLLRIDHQTLRRKWFDPKTSLPWLQWSLVGMNYRVAGLNRVYASLNKSGHLAYLDLETGKFSLIDSRDKSLFYSFRGLITDRKGIMWCATKIGLLRLNPVTNKYKLYTVRDGRGLPEDNLMSIELDKEDNIWFTTQHHIGKFDREVFFCFDLRGQAGYFPNGSSGKMADGRLLFGARNGLYVIDPINLRTETSIARVFLTDIILGGQSTPLNKSPEYLTNLQLDFSQNDCAFEFAALEYLSPENLRYKYRLLGLNNEWSAPTAERRVNFASLQPGEYTFQVIASSANGKWTHGKNALSIHLTILPPWYRTTYAYTAWILLLATLVYFIFKYRLNRYLEKKETLRIKELSTVKTRLFTNITHEFRTPLTLILGPAQTARKQLGKMSTSELETNLSAIERNGRTLLERVNQLLEISKIEAGLMDCHYEQTDVVLFLKYLLGAFYSLAESKGIRIEFRSTTESLVMDVDKEKWQTIVSNLLTNAIKYTPEGGSVILEFSEREKGVEFKVKDTGIGIPKDQLAHVFDRFFQADNDHGSDIKGSGIGLTLVREYVHLLNGRIRVESEERKGSVFTVVLPLTRLASAFWQVMPIEAPSPPTQKPKKKGWHDTGTPLVLIIEDHEEVASFIGQCLEQDFRLVFASNGREGLERAKELIPDFIISDVMMPEMTGLEVCSRLKADELTLHIPILLLTAKAGRQARLEGLKCGSDAYLTKPFDAEELRIRINNMVELRQKMRQKFASGPNDIRMETTAGFFETGDPFLQKVNTLIDTHLDDPALNADLLSGQIYYSKMQVHRKIKALTGLSTANYVRTYRLHRSLDLLRSGQYNISEVAWLTGFSSLSYFSASFKDTFGVSPQQLLHNT